jgi:hypothetical protein
MTASTSDGHRTLPLAGAARKSTSADLAAEAATVNSDVDEAYQGEKSHVNESGEQDRAQSNRTLTRDRVDSRPRAR